MSNNSYLPSTWFDPRLEKRPSVIHGHGVFASSPFAQGETIMIWGGVLYTRQQLQDINEGKLKVEPFSYSFIDEDILMGAPEGGLDYFVNHSCDPSVWMNGDVQVVARRDIPAGGEISGDYALWEAEPTYEMDCACGAAMCRHQISGNDWQRPELQVRYAGHFLPYITRRIIALGHSS